MKRFVSLFLAVLTAFSVCSVAFAQDNTADDVTGFTAEDFLETDGQDIVNQKGEKVRLKGVNLGAWMIWHMKEKEFCW